MIQFLNNLKKFLENKDSCCELNPVLNINNESIVFITSNNYLISKYFFNIVKTYAIEQDIDILENSKNFMSMEKSLDNLMALIKESCNNNKKHIIMLNNFDVFFDDETCLGVAKELIDYIKNPSDDFCGIVFLTNRSKSIEPFLMESPSHLKINQVWCLGEYVCRKIEQKSMEKLLAESIDAVNKTLACKYF